MSMQNKNRPGYKKTKFGWIPQEWDCIKLKTTIKLISGQHIEAKYCNTNKNNTPYLTGPTDFVNGKINATKYTSKPKILCKKGDILIICKGSGTGTR